MKKSGIAGKSQRQKSQSVLLLGSDPNRSTVCDTCGMTFFKHIKSDRETHLKYHQTFQTGVKWPFHCDVLEHQSIKYQLKHIQIHIVTIDPKLDPQIRRVDEALKMVNLELNAPPGLDAWKRKEEILEARAFLAVANKRMVGICTTERVVKEQSKWMVLKTQTVVPNQTNQHAIIGISRIWVAPNWRKKGVASYLLKAVLENSVYGIKLHKRQVSFSQPSTNGSLLARHFNGVTHKSGEILLPVYLE